MFGSMTKSMVLGALAAVSALAGPAAANASGTWATSGAISSGSMPGKASGALTLVPVGSALRVTCDVTLDLSLANPNATLWVTGATFANCVTNIPGCSQTVTSGGASSTLPWPGTGDAATQMIAISNWYVLKQFGSGCPAPFTSGWYSEAGTLSPVLDTSTETINFDGTAGTGTLTGPLGTAYMDGSLDVTTPGPLGLV